VCRSLEEFCSLLSEIPLCFGMLQGPLKVRVSLHNQNGPPPPPKPLQIPWFILGHLATAQLFQWIMHSNCTVISVRNAVRDTAHLVYHSPCTSLWVEISTLAYKSNSSCCPKMLSVACCTHIIQTKLMLKNRRYPQKSIFSATGVPTDVPLVVLG